VVQGGSSRGVSTFHGVELDSSRIGGVRYRTSAFPGHFVTAAHAHEEPYFCLVVEGCSQQRSGNNERFRELGSAYFYPSGEVQSECFGERGSRLFSIELGTEARAQLRATTPLPDSSAELTGLAALAVRRLYLEWRAGDSVCIEDLTSLLVASLVRERCDAIRWAPVVRDYLHTHFRERLTLDRIARAAGVHPVHLSRAFPKRFGVTLGAYLRGLRLDDAARRLAATDRPIADIALDSGFASQAHLTRELKRQLGTTPGSYRRGSAGRG
jgi:AraC family transcriptional regulator